jgi:ABC-type polysaccharide/polyol phosphate export permease
MRFAKLLVNFPRFVSQNSYMLRSMVVRDIRSRYVGSFLGIFWALVHPLTQLMIFYFIFSIVLKARLGEEYSGVHYAFWLMSGMLPWMLFAEIVNRSPGAVLEQANLIKKTVFPSEIISLAHASAAIVTHLIASSILLGFLIIRGPGISLTLLWLPIFLLGVILFAIGLAWTLAALNVFLRDIGQVLGTIINIWFFLTPIIYPLHLIPGNLQKWVALNPMLYPVEGYRMALLGRTDMSPAGLAVLFVCGLTAFVLGGLIFKKLQPAFSDVL